MSRYSILSLARNALTGHRHWERLWRSPTPRRQYDVVIIGGGAHGLATAYYLVKVHGITNVAVLEKSWLGGGNTGRNTTIVRSNYNLPANAAFYEFALKQWEGLSAELNYNLMFSQRGVLTLSHAVSDFTGQHRTANAMRLNGVEAEVLGVDEIRRRIPLLDTSATARYPILGGFLQQRAGTVRHDAVAWAYARAADAFGVDIIQNCEVTGIRQDENGVSGVDTTRGPIDTRKLGLCVAGHSGVLAGMAGLRLPIESHVLQAMVTEPIKPVLDHVLVSRAWHFYISQTDKGEIVLGADLDGYNTYAQRGGPNVVDHVVEGCLALFPSFSRLKLMRTWGGVMDMSMDGSPIIGTTPVKGLYFNGGWCYGGFKATPAAGWTFAHTIAQDAPHALNAAYTLDRFASGHTLDERGAGPFPWRH